jgi:hypothetical protein
VVSAVKGGTTGLHSQSGLLAATEIHLNCSVSGDEPVFRLVAAESTTDADEFASARRIPRERCEPRPPGWTRRRTPSKPMFRRSLLRSPMHRPGGMPAMRSGSLMATLGVTRQSTMAIFTCVPVLVMMQKRVTSLAVPAVVLMARNGGIGRVDLFARS